MSQTKTQPSQSRFSFGHTCTEAAASPPDNENAQKQQQLARLDESLRKATAAKSESALVSAIEEAKMQRGFVTTHMTCDL